MSRYRIDFVVVFLVGLVAVGWVGAGYVGSNLLALTVTMVIAACYVAGALELHRYQQATSTLTAAIADLSGTPPRLSAWLDGLHASLRSAVRLRIEGERVALPGPALTPYLVGLLVLLGMLGTLLGMVTTLRGTGVALDSATDLQAIRESLAAPVRGLGFAFGTSIAGVATSAMLGLLSALCRRERAHAAQQLDAKIATTLRIYSQSQQREDTFGLMQRQAEMMPTLVDRLQTMMTAIEHQSLALNERLAASQHAFHGKTEAAYARLASSVAQSLKESAAESARAAGAALQPAMEATMAGHAREMAALRETVTNAVQQQLDGLSSGFQSTTTTVADLWNKALAGHQRSSESLVQDLRASLDQFTQTFEQRSAGLLEGVSTRLEATAGGVSQAWNDALARQERASESIAERNHHALATAAATFEQHAAALLRAVDQSHADLQAQWAGRDEERLEAWRESLGAVAATLSKEWEEAGARAATRQQDICDTLARTASDISAQTQAHASGTIAEISRLVQAASEAPRAAAEVIAELRQKLTDSMARDNAMLEERSRLLETLDTLLDAVNHASTEQRTAVDALVATSADMLARVGTQFTDKVEAETRKLNDVAAQVTGSAVEVASLGEAFGVAVKLFGESNDKLTAHLQRIEAALDKSLMRSDEQLAYYVAQAKEVIDLSMLSQKQIVEDLQQLAAQRASAGAESA
ncbi:DUF802 domain-containing protein [Paraburkholderia sp. CNPSo 3157]|uniref:DUF802 domain-containing protein n=1 Tax=Paraburkholderia franconis TaxID=2654983 RepID=A0A7X1NDY8_9BURK|nr:DUF802 domain-containing protein [Paraburkholderia franconis]MPW20197.1 DUF802 domain-containing protein [Paraburkholderia franconis]